MFAYIQPACNLADREAPRGTAAARIWICFRKMCLEKTQPQHTHAWAQEVMGQFFLEMQKKREKKKNKKKPSSSPRGGGGDLSLLLPQSQGTRVGQA